LPIYFSNLAWAHATLGQFGDADRYIAEALDTVKSTGESWYEAEANRIAGEIMLLSPQHDLAIVQTHFDRAMIVAEVGCFEPKAT
jgi:hypothetical protein